MNVSRWLARRRMAALTKAVYDSALTEDNEPAEPSVARLLPGGASVAALIVVIVLIAAVGVWRHAAAREHAQGLAQSSSEREESEAAPVATGPSPSPSASAGEHADVVVYVSGAVASPGVLTLPASSRVIDAITAAGGATPEADLESINLARILVDGEQIRVAVVGDSPPASSEAGTTVGACVRLAPRPSSRPCPASDHPSRSASSPTGPPTLACPPSKNSTTSPESAHPSSKRSGRVCADE